jgi:hypothetical protein
MRRRRRIDTAIDFNFSKVYRLDDELAAIHMEPNPSSFLLQSCRIVYHLLLQRHLTPPACCRAGNCAAGASSITTVETCIGAAA